MKKVKGSKRVILTLIIHLFFGMIFPFIITIFDDTTLYVPVGSWEIDLTFIAATLVAFLTWGIDEILRNRFSQGAR